MNDWSTVLGLSAVAASMVGLAFVESAIPLRALGPWRLRHLTPNLSLTVLTLALSLGFNVPIVFLLDWATAHRIGLLNAVFLPSFVASFIAIAALDLCWYVTHRAMHQIPSLWRFHAVHHSDLAVDVTTTIRQHPGESVVRYCFMALFALGVGASPAAFAFYRMLSAVQGAFEHANIRLPHWLDHAVSWVTPSPNMHKIHHANERALTDSNYSNIFSIWDRLFGTFTPPRREAEARYGLDAAFGAPRHQTTLGLLLLPIRKRSDNDLTWS